MAHAQFMDELIREYLLFRGFAPTLKSFDSELKVDRDRSFRVDKIIEQLIQCITNYDLTAVRELWGHLESRMFSKLESQFMPGVKKLENGVLKLYLINSATNSKTDKIMEFFVRMTPELQNQAEWKDWFIFPYIKNHEENPTFSLHFTKQWQDTLLVSLHNFLASIFQYMPTPALLHFEEDASKIAKLEQRNESLRNRLALLIDKGSDASNLAPCQVEPPADLLDDFYIIAQENSADSQAKSFKSLILNMGAGTSPVMGRREAGGAKKRLPSASRSAKSGLLIDS